MNWNDIFYVDDGVLRWKENKARARSGDPAGTLVNGYVSIKVNQKRYYAHRIVWEIYKGKIPDGMQIDHENHVRNDNRIENLRLVTPGENRKNMSMRSSNKSGVNGVSWSVERKSWVAQIQVNGVNINLGRFHDFDSAVLVRKDAEKRYCFHKNHGA